LAAPFADDGPDPVRPIELRNAEIAEMISDAIEPCAPLRPRRGRKLLVIVARLVIDNDETEAFLVRRAVLLDRFAIAGDEFGAAGLADQPRTASPRIPIGAAFR
jgi:hypothetical protein